MTSKVTTLSTIWKFPLPWQDDQIIVNIPHGAKPLCVQLQGGVPTLWRLVDQNEDPDEWHFLVVGTGHTFNLEDWHYIGTWQQDGFVWHLFGPEAVLQ